MTKKKDKNNIVNLESKRPVCKCNECDKSSNKEDLYVHSKCCNADLDVMVTASGRIEYKCQVCGKEAGKNIFSFLTRDNMVYTAIGYSNELYKLINGVLTDIECELTSFIDFCIFNQIKTYINSDDEEKQQFREYVEMCISAMESGNFFPWAFEKEEDE
jgi:hypothetical protein